MSKAWVLWGVLLLGTAAMLVQIWTLVGISQSNHAITDMTAGKDVPLDKIVNDAPEVRLARAMALKKQQRYDEALATLNLILDAPDPALQTKIRNFSLPTGSRCPNQIRQRRNGVSAQQPILKIMPKRNLVL
ncbi:MAG: hypothetical protein K9L25_10085 [Methylovulum sp.]|nr:hypothetical protein [Methylovulum sp.]